jgi:hypothetical protein
MEVKRYTMTISEDYGKVQILGITCPNGAYVAYEDYEHLSDYCDRLVEVSKLPCLPKDLENLRAANTAFAQENHELQVLVEDLKGEIKGWENKWKCAIEMAAKAEIERDRYQEEYYEAVKLREVWYRKWQTARNECITKVDAVKELLDEIAYKA